MQRRTITLLISAVLVLITIGIVMMYSASLVRGEAHYEQAEHFLMRQVGWLCISLPAAIICARINLNFFQKIAIPAVIISAFFLVVVRIPGIGREINGSWRWIRFGPLAVQPSEFSKIGILLGVSWWVARKRRYMHTFKRGILVPILGLGMFAVLLLAEPDFGTTLLISLVILAVLYVSGAKPAYLISLTALGAIGFGVLLAFNDNRMRRIIAFLDPEKYAQKEAWQLVNALNAFASGGWKGVGLGNSIQKMHYLPEAHTDFIFPIIGEELGLIATAVVMLLFVIIFFCGLRIASRAHNDFGRFLAFGITLIITLQAIINFAVVTGSMPTKGLALPFISYGGSSMLVCSVMIGMLVNIAQTARDPETKKSAELFKDKRRRS